jgi:hypothetical protein
LLQLKMPQILLHDRWHRHSQRGREILQRHGSQFFRILQKIDQTIRQVLRVAGAVEFHCQILALRHLLEVGQVRAHDRHTESAREVRYPAGTS